MSDFHVTNHGSVFILRALTEQAQSWVNRRLPEEKQEWGDGIAVEHRYIVPIVKGILEDGLSIQRGGLSPSFRPGQRPSVPEQGDRDREG